MKTRTLRLSLVALLVLGAVATMLVADEAYGDTLVTFDFQNATAGSGGGLGDLIVPASLLDPAFTSGTFSWTDPDGFFAGFTDHGVQTFGFDDSTDNVYVGRGTGPDLVGTHYVITLNASAAWVLTGFSVQQQVNDPDYSVDIVAVQGSSSAVLGTIAVSGGFPDVQSLSGLNHNFAAGVAQILILPQVTSPTGSGYFAVDDINIEGTVTISPVDLACPCDGGWKNYGDYVSCVTKVAQALVKAGDSTGAEKGAIVSARAQNSCGKK